MFYQTYTARRPPKGPKISFLFLDLHTRPRRNRVDNPNGKSIGLAASAHLTAESPYKLLNNGRPSLSPKIAPSHGKIWTHLIHDSLGESQPIIQKAARSVQPF